MGEIKKSLRESNPDMTFLIWEEHEEGSNLNEVRVKPAHIHQVDYGPEAH